MKPTFHRDNTVTFWAVYEQRWIRVAAQRISDEELAGMNFDERARVIRMAGSNWHQWQIERSLRQARVTGTAVDKEVR